MDITKMMITDAMDFDTDKKAFFDMLAYIIKNQCGYGTLDRINYIQSRFKEDFVILHHKYSDGDTSYDMINITGNNALADIEEIARELMGFEAHGRVRFKVDVLERMGLYEEAMK